MERLLTVADVCELTAISQRTIRACLKDGRLVGHKIGGQWRFTQDDLKAFINGEKASQTLSSDAVNRLKSFVSQCTEAKDMQGTEVEMRIRLKPAHHLQKENREKVLRDFAKSCDDAGLTCSYDERQLAFSGPFQVMGPLMRMLQDIKDSFES